MISLTLNGPSATRHFARALAALVISRPADSHALTIALIGELGAGKTTFTRAFARALGYKRPVTSPTFLIVRRYPLPRLPFPYRFLGHVDAYRLHSVRDARSAGVHELLADPHGLVLVEWADRISRLLPRNRITITLHHGSGAESRNIALRLPRWYKGKHYEDFLEEITRIDNRD